MEQNSSLPKSLLGTVVATADGSALLVYHGSGADIEQFDYAYTDAGADQLGSGFYFTTNFDEAHGYAFKTKQPDLQKPGGQKTPTVVHAWLDIKNPLTPSTIGKGLSATMVRAMLVRSPCQADVLENFGDVDFEGHKAVFERAVQAYVVKAHHKAPLLKSLFSVANDFFPDHVEQFNKAVFEVLGYDGASNTFEDGTVHYVAFFPEQVHIQMRQPVVDTQADGAELEQTFDGPAP